MWWSICRGVRRGIDEPLRLGKPYGEFVEVPRHVQEMSDSTERVGRSGSHLQRPWNATGVTRISTSRGKYLKVHTADYRGVARGHSNCEVRESFSGGDVKDRCKVGAV